MSGYGLYALYLNWAVQGYVSVALMAIYIYWAMLLRSILCVIYSVEMGFRVSLGYVLCVLGVMRYGVLILDDEVIVPVEASAFCGGEAMDGEVQPFLFVFLLVANWQAPLSGLTLVMSFTYGEPSTD